MERQVALALPPASPGHPLLGQAAAAARVSPAAAAAAVVAAGQVEGVTAGLRQQEPPTPAAGAVVALLDRLRAMDAPVVRV
jgi:hypothetical protein